MKSKMEVGLQAVAHETSPGLRELATALDGRAPLPPAYRSTLK